MTTKTTTEETKPQAPASTTEPKPLAIGDVVIYKQHNPTGGVVDCAAMVIAVNDNTEATLQVFAPWGQSVATAAQGYELGQWRIRD